MSAEDFMNKEFVKKNKHALIMAGIILLLFLRVIYVFNFEKEGYHSDEIWCYGLANSYYDPLIFTSDNVFEAGDYEDRQNFNEWLSADVVRDYIMVSDEDKFAYDSVIYNQSRDQLPPLHYILLHTVCSFFPNTFSMWYGLSINLLMLILTCLCVYATGKILYASKTKALLALSLYAFSIGALQTFMYIRMYATVTFFTSLLVYLHTKLILDLKYTKKMWIALIVTTALGGLSHYVFLFFAFFLAAVFCIYYLCKRQIKRLFYYASSMLLGVGGVILVFPYAIEQLIGNRTDRAVIPSRLEFVYVINRVFMENTGIFTQVYHSALHVYLLGILFLIIMISGSAIFILRNDERLRRFFANLKSDLKSGLHKFAYLKSRRIMLVLAIAIATLAEVLVTAFICNVIAMAQHSDRYLFCIYPMFCLIFSLLIYILVRLALDNINHRRFAIVFTILAFIILSNVRNVNNYIFPTDIIGISISEAAEGSDVIIGMTADWLYVTYPNHLINADKIFAFNLSEYEDMGEYLKALPDDGKDVYFVLDASIFEALNEQKENGTKSSTFLGLNLPNKLQYEGEVEFDCTLEDIAAIFNNVEGVKSFDVVGSEKLFGRKQVIYKLR